MESLIVRLSLEWKTAIKGEITLEESTCLLPLMNAIPKLVDKDKPIPVSLLQLHMQPVVSKKGLYILGDKL